jgi:hypothetical protein
MMASTCLLLKIIKPNMWPGAMVIPVISATLEAEIRRIMV